jgi:hypothetical protein
MLDPKRPCPVPGYQVEFLDGEIILFYPAGQKIFHSNRSGALIWQLCDGRRTVADITQILSEAYPEDARQIQADVQDTLQLFAEHEAITWR